MKLEKDDKLITPGPTQYNINLSPETPQWTINASKRKLLKNVRYPSSRIYNYRSKIGEGPKYSFGPFLSTKNIRVKNTYEVPGPGSYDIKYSENGPRYTMGARIYAKKILKKYSACNTEVPPVGLYQVRKDKDFDVPCFRFAKSKRTNLDMNEQALKYPGPTKYTANYTITCTKTPSWSFGHGDRFPDNKKKIIYRPKFYKTQEIFGTEGPFYSFSKKKDNHVILEKEELKKSKEFPSVGKYCTDIKYIPDQPLFSFPRENEPKKNNDKNNASNPGPGKYSPSEEFSSTYKKTPQWSWSKSKVSRDENAKVEGSKKIHIISPGPGQYNYKTGNIPQGPKYTFRPNLKKIKIVEFPGPGKYNINGKKNKVDGYTMSGGKLNEEIKLVLKDNFPGPGSYKIKDSSTKGFTVPISKGKIDKKDSFPGPGSYKIPTSFDYVNNMAREGGAFDPKFRYI